VLFALLIAPLATWSSALVVGLCTFVESDTAFITADAFGIPFGLFIGSTTGFIPAKGRMFVFTANAFIVSTTLLSAAGLLGLGVLGLLPIVYVLSILLYYYINNKIDIYYGRVS